MRYNQNILINHNQYIHKAKPQCSFDHSLSKLIKTSFFWPFRTNFEYKHIKNKWHILAEYGKVKIIDCSFYKCRSSDGGAIKSCKAEIIIQDSIFSENFAKNSGAISISDSCNAEISNTQLIKNSAKRFGAMHVDGQEVTNKEYIQQTNFTQNYAKAWIGGLRLQHNEGKISECFFDGNFAPEFGALFDFGYSPGERSIDLTIFLNNTSKEIGSGLTIYHSNFNGKITNSIFIGNRNENHFLGGSIYLHSDSDILFVEKCKFDQPEKESILVYFADTSKIMPSDNDFDN